MGHFDYFFARSGSGVEFLAGTNQNFWFPGGRCFLPSSQAYLNKAASNRRVLECYRIG